MLQETTEGSIFGKDLPRASATANQQEKDQRKSRKWHHNVNHFPPNKKRLRNGNVKPEGKFANLTFFKIYLYLYVNDLHEYNNNNNNNDSNNISLGKIQYKIYFWIQKLILDVWLDFEVDN